MSFRGAKAGIAAALLAISATVLACFVTEYLAAKLQERRATGEIPAMQVRSSIRQEVCPWDAQSTSPESKHKQPRTNMCHVSY